MDLGAVGYLVSPVSVSVGGYGASLGAIDDYMHVAGTVAFDGAPAVRTVMAFDRINGVVVAIGDSDSAGVFTLPMLRSSDVLVVALDESRNALIYDRITPV